MKINPNLPKLKYLFIASVGKNEAKILEPSSGGIGIKLKIARNIFIYIAELNIWLIKKTNCEPALSDDKLIEKFDIFKI